MKEEKDGERLDREDPSVSRQEGYTAFVKDKRKRISSQSTEKVEYRRRETESGENPGFEKRRSYNPNFTADNRPVGERRTYDRNDDNRTGYGSRSEYGEKKEYPPREGSVGNYGEKREYAPRNSNGERKDYTPRKDYGERKEYTPRREYGERKEYAPRSEYGQRREFTPREGSSGNYGEKREYTPRNSYGERKEYTPRKDYGERKEYAPRREYGERRDSMSAGGQQRQYPGKRDYEGRSQNGPRKPYQKQGSERGSSFPKYTSENYPTFPPPPIEDKIRLNRYISMSGICSRREADEFIQKGMITVNGEVITEMGAKVSATDEVKFNGNVLSNEKKVYIVMNKPKGFVTSVDDPHAEKTVMDLLKNGCRERVYPVGRLDKSSLGVMLITNDGDLAKKLTHPSFEKKKVYQVSLDKPLTKVDMDSIVNGITLDDGEIKADSISYVAGKKDEVGIEIHSGRNRIVRRIFEHLGYRVTKLDRVYFAGLTKQRLKRGEWRFLSPREVQALLSGRYE